MTYSLDMLSLQEISLMPVDAVRSIWLCLLILLSCLYTSNQHTHTSVLLLFFCIEMVYCYTITYIQARCIHCNTYTLICSRALIHGKSYTDPYSPLDMQPCNGRSINNIRQSVHTLLYIPQKEGTHSIL